MKLPVRGKLRTARMYTSRLSKLKNKYILPLSQHLDTLPPFIFDSVGHGLAYKKDFCSIINEYYLLPAKVNWKAWNGGDLTKKLCIMEKQLIQLLRKVGYPSLKKLLTFFDLSSSKKLIFFEHCA